MPHLWGTLDNAVSVLDSVGGHSLPHGDLDCLEFGGHHCSGHHSCSEGVGGDLDIGGVVARLKMRGDNLSVPATTDCGTALAIVLGTGASGTACLSEGVLASFSITDAGAVNLEISKLNLVEIRLARAIKLIRNVNIGLRHLVVDSSTVNWSIVNNLLGAACLSALG